MGNAIIVLQSRVSVVATGGGLDVDHFVIWKPSGGRTVLSVLQRMAVSVLQPKITGDVTLLC